jgi:hypothetical protein
MARVPVTVALIEIYEMIGKQLLRVNRILFVLFGI